MLRPGSAALAATLLAVTAACATGTRAPADPDGGAGGGDGAAADACLPGAEACNGRDDDCDGQVDDGFAVGQPCTVGVGACARTGMTACAAGGAATACDATPGAPAAEVCGDGVDQDCDGADASCIANDLPAGAIDVSAGGTFTVDLAGARDDDTGSCGQAGGRDVFYQLSLPAAEVVYVDTFGSTYDSVVRVYAGACATRSAEQACFDDPAACAGVKQAQGALQLQAGTYCLVVDQRSAAEATGATTLRVVRGGRTGAPLAGASGSVSGTTVGKANQTVGGCQTLSSKGDDGFYFLTCPGQTRTVSATTCNAGTTIDSVIYLRTGAATSADVACSDDDSACTSQSILRSTFSGKAVTGPNLHWLIVDAYGSDGAYQLAYTLQ